MVLWYGTMIGYYGISRDRDVISKACCSRISCGIVDTDFVVAFHWLRSMIGFVKY